MRRLACRRTGQRPARQQSGLRPPKTPESRRGLRPGDVNDQIHVVPGSAAGTWTIKFVGGGGNKCLDLPGGQSANYTALEVWDCRIILKNHYAGRCLSNGMAHGGDNSSAVTILERPVGDVGSHREVTAGRERRLSPRCTITPT